MASVQGIASIKRASGQLGEIGHCVAADEWCGVMTKPVDEMQNLFKVWKIQCVEDECMADRWYTVSSIDDPRHRCWYLDPADGGHGYWPFIRLVDWGEIFVVMTYSRPCSTARLWCAESITEKARMLFKFEKIPGWSSYYIWNKEDVLKSVLKRPLRVNWHRQHGDERWFITRPDRSETVVKSSKFQLDYLDEFPIL